MINEGAGFAITHVHLETEAAVPALGPQKFHELAEAAKRDCPVSQALAGTNITLTAHPYGS